MDDPGSECFVCVSAVGLIHLRPSHVQPEWVLSVLCLAKKKKNSLKLLACRLSHLFLHRYLLGTGRVPGNGTRVGGPVLRTYTAEGKADSTRTLKYMM